MNHLFTESFNTVLLGVPDTVKGAGNAAAKQMNRQKQRYFSLKLRSTEEKFMMDNFEIMQMKLVHKLDMVPSSEPSFMAV